MAKDEERKHGKGFTVRDQRWWLDESEIDQEQLVDPEIKLPSYVEDLENRIEEKNNTLQEYIQAHKSSVSDMDQTRARIQKDLDRRLEIEKGKLVEPFIEVLDNMNRLWAAAQQNPGAQDLEAGMGLIIRQLEDQLAKMGLETISCQGQAFDPSSMEALMTTEVSVAQAGMVLEEVRPGYRLGERVVRPAGVRVGVSK